MTSSSMRIAAAADENNSVFIGVVLKMKFVEDRRRYSRYSV